MFAGQLIGLLGIHIFQVVQDASLIARPRQVLHALDAKFIYFLYPVLIFALVLLCCRWPCHRKTSRC